jgi:hypothetical protein
MGGKMGFLTAALFSVSAFASPHSRCEEMVQDLKAMQAAQRQLLQSLGEKNQIIAMVLDQNAQKLEKLMSKQRTLRKSDLSSLHVSAKAFRGHEKRETALIAKFQHASDELLTEVESCLEKHGEIEKLGQR